MLNFDIPRFSRVCTATSRELRPGEWFYSLLLEENREIKRFDYSYDDWPGPPVELIGFWKSRVPLPNDTKMKLAPNDILLNLFDQLSDQPEKLEMRYVLTLLLVRRRIFRLEKEEINEIDEKIMTVYCPKREMTYFVPVSRPSDDKIEELQTTLAGLLYS